MTKISEIAFKLRDNSSYVNNLIFWWESCGLTSQEKSIIEKLKYKIYTITNESSLPDNEVIEIANEINIIAEELRRNIDNKLLKDMLKVFVINFKIVGN